MERYGICYYWLQCNNPWNRHNKSLRSLSNKMPAWLCRKIHQYWYCKKAETSVSSSYLTNRKWLIYQLLSGCLSELLAVADETGLSQLLLVWCCSMAWQLACAVFRFFTAKKLLGQLFIIYVFYSTTQLIYVARCSCNVIVHSNNVGGCHMVMHI